MTQHPFGRKFSEKEAATLKAEQKLTDEDTDQGAGDNEVTTEALGEEGDDDPPITTEALGEEGDS